MNRLLSVARDLRNRLGTTRCWTKYIETISSCGIGHCKSFNAKMGDECLKTEFFLLDEGVTCAG
jgi:hypothetical protein